MIRSYKNTAIQAFKKVHIGAGLNPETGFTFATADGSQALDIDLRFPVGKTITVDFGDGTATDYNGAGSSTNVTIAKTYSSAGTYPIKFYGDYTDLTYLNCFSNSLSGDVSGWSALTSLTTLLCFDNSLSGDVSSWSALTSLTTLRCFDNSLSGDVSSWSALTSLTYLSCNNNSLSGDVSSWSALTSLTILNCDNNSLSGDVSSWSALTSLTTLLCINNSLSGDVSSWSALTSLTTLRCFDNSLTGLTINANSIGICDVDDNDFTTAAVDAFFLNTANYFELNAPTTNCTYDFSGASMGIPTGGASNADIVRLVGYYTNAGFTATVIVRTS